MRTPRGRVATAHAYRHFGLMPLSPAASGNDLFGGAP
jgi:Holliday junction DNA helicase RuvB